MLAVMLNSLISISLALLHVAIVTVNVVFSFLSVSDQD